MSLVITQIKVQPFQEICAQNRWQIKGLVANQWQINENLL